MCGGALVRKLITHEVAEGPELFVFDDVPAWVCAQCDGVWLEGEIKRRIEETIAREKQR